MYVCKYLRTLRVCFSQAPYSYSLTIKHTHAHLCPPTNCRNGVARKLQSQWTSEWQNQYKFKGNSKKKNMKNMYQFRRMQNEMCNLKLAVRYKVDNRFMISHVFVSFEPCRPLTLPLCRSVHIILVERKGCLSLVSDVCMCVCVRSVLFFALQPPTLGLFLRCVHPLFAAQPLPQALPANDVDWAEFLACVRACA